MRDLTELARTDGVNSCTIDRLATGAQTDAGHPSGGSVQPGRTRLAVAQFPVPSSWAQPAHFGGAKCNFGAESQGTRRPPEYPDDDDTLLRGRNGAGHNRRTNC